MILRLLPLFIPILVGMLLLGFYWGKQHAQKMAKIDAPDEPVIFDDLGGHVTDGALSADDLDNFSDKEIDNHFDNTE